MKPSAADYRAAFPAIALVFAIGCSSNDVSVGADSARAAASSANKPAPPAGGGQIRPSNLTWTAPAAFTLVPSPSPMRLATYKVGDGGELTVSQVGGDVKANIDRWKGQFTEPKERELAETTIGELKVTLVWFEGTYAGMAPPGGAPGAAKADWAMLSAIVEWPNHGDPHFFKLTGPKGAVEAARPAFDELVQSLTPKP
jgi:hypothetical protein